MPRNVTKIATRLALALAGAGLVVTGIVLLLRAAWIAIALPLGAIWASVIMGSALLLAGALVAFLSTRTPRRPERSETELIVLITNAFLQGLAAGRSVRNR